MGHLWDVLPCYGNILPEGAVVTLTNVGEPNTPNETCDAWEMNQEWVTESA